VTCLHRWKGGDGWTARSPAHNDRHNGLGVLFYGHADCGWQEITIETIEEWAKR
jgi:hypothetical protein